MFEALDFKPALPYGRASETRLLANRDFQRIGDIALGCGVGKDVDAVITGCGQRAFPVPRAISQLIRHSRTVQVKTNLAAGSQMQRHILSSACLQEIVMTHASMDSASFDRGGASARKLDPGDDARAFLGDDGERHYEYENRKKG